MSLISPLVYIIEDDDVYQKYLAKRVEDMGAKYSNFSDGESALEKIKKKPDLILLDFSLKGLNGLDTLRAIKEKSKTSRVFVLTGLDDPKVAEACLSNGAEKYLLKDEESIEHIHTAIEELKKKKKATAILITIVIILIALVTYLFV